MKCVICGHDIRKKETRSYIRDLAKRKRYGCLTCSNNGTFDAWVDAYEQYADLIRESRQHLLNGHRKEAQVAINVAKQYLQTLKGIGK